MALDLIGLGTVPNDDTGDDLRTAGGKLNNNFAVLEDATIQVNIDGGGAAIATGLVPVSVEVPFTGTIVGNRLLADQSGAIVVDVWKDTYANYPPTDADTITASAPPTIAASGIKSEDLTLTGWTTAVAKGDILRFNVDSVTAIEFCTLVLVLEKTVPA